MKNRHKALEQNIKKQISIEQFQSLVQKLL